MQKITSFLWSRPASFQFHEKKCNNLYILLSRLNIMDDNECHYPRYPLEATGGFPRQIGVLAFWLFIGGGSCCYFGNYIEEGQMHARWDDLISKVYKTAKGGDDVFDYHEQRLFLKRVFPYGYYGSDSFGKGEELIIRPFNVERVEVVAVNGENHKVVLGLLDRRELKDYLQK